MNNDNKSLMTPDFLSMFLKVRGAKENMKATNRPTWGQQAEPRGVSYMDQCGADEPKGRLLIWTNVEPTSQKGGSLYGPTRGQRVKRGGFLYGSMWGQQAKRGAFYMDQHRANEPKGGLLI